MLPLIHWTGNNAFLVSSSAVIQEFPWLSIFVFFFFFFPCSFEACQPTIPINFALDSLLKTVPSDVLDKGRVIADAYRSSDDEDAGNEISDPELKQLESIL